MQQQLSEDLMKKVAKYRNRRPKKSFIEQQPKGPAYKNFKQYFDGEGDSDSETSWSSDSASNMSARDQPKRKKKVAHKEDEDSGNDQQSSSSSDFRPLSESSSDDENSIFPKREAIVKNARPAEDLDTSESEPEDPEKVRIFREQMESRRSKKLANNSRFISNKTLNATNKTFNGTMNRTRFVPPAVLSENCPDLLSLSSSSDEEGVPLNFIVKESDDEEEKKSASEKNNNNSKKTDKENKPVKPPSKKNLTNEFNKSYLKEVDSGHSIDQSPEETLKRNKPNSKENVSGDDDEQPLLSMKNNNNKNLNKTIPKETESEKEAEQPKSVKKNDVTKTLNKTNPKKIEDETNSKKSEKNEPDKQPKKNQPKSKKLNKTNPTPKSTRTTRLSKTKQIPEKSPTLNVDNGNDPEPVELIEDIVETFSSPEADEGLIVTAPAPTGRKSSNVTFAIDAAEETSGSDRTPLANNRKRSIHVSTPKPRDLSAVKVLSRSRPSKLSISENKQRFKLSSSPAVIKEASEKNASSDVNDNENNGKVVSKRISNRFFVSKDVVPESADDVFSPLIEASTVANDDGQEMEEPETLNKTATKPKRGRPAKNADNSVSNSAPRPLRSSINPSVQAQSPAKNSSKRIKLAAAQTVQISTEYDIPEPVSYGGTYMAYYRAASESDPVQHCLTHLSPSLSTVMWKLLPNINTSLRTCGATSLIVYDGEIEINGKTLRRMDFTKFDAGTYLVKNVGDTIAHYEVIEYFN